MTEHAMTFILVDCFLPTAQVIVKDLLANALYSFSPLAELKPAAFTDGLHGTFPSLLTGPDHGSLTK
jgi:hypothetical protein